MFSIIILTNSYLNYVTLSTFQHCQHVYIMNNLKYFNTKTNNNLIIILFVDSIKFKEEIITL
jgi:hypothetical protein